VLILRYVSVVSKAFAVKKISCFLQKRKLTEYVLSYISESYQKWLTHSYLVVVIRYKNIAGVLYLSRIRFPLRDTTHYL